MNLSLNNSGKFAGNVIESLGFWGGLLQKVRPARNLDNGVPGMWKLDAAQTFYPDGRPDRDRKFDLCYVTPACG